MREKKQFTYDTSVIHQKNGIIAIQKKQIYNRFIQKAKENHPHLEGKNLNI